MSAAERNELRPIVREFLHQKTFVPVEGFRIEDHHRYAIALQAAIPIRHLGIRAYRRFRSIYVFAEAFRERTDGMYRPGHNAMHLAGLAVQGGGVALAWSEARRGFAHDSDGYNPVIHEFVHKLDMIDGAADGRPPLPKGITQREWFDTFSGAFKDFQDRVEHHRKTRLSDYAATNPAEFFAVLSEVYFEDPEVLEKEYPRVLKLLRGFYTSRIE